MPGNSTAHRQRPKTRADCINGPRPCPWVGCRYHLFLEIRQGGQGNGKLYFRWPGKELNECEHTCALDLAEEPLTSYEIAQILGVSHQAILYAERQALQRLAQTYLCEFMEDDQ